MCNTKIFEKENEVDVVSLKFLDSENTEFRCDENDISLVNKTGILEKLPAPEMLNTGKKLKCSSPK